MITPASESSGRTPAQMGMKPPSEGTRAPLFLLLGQPEDSGHDDEATPRPQPAGSRPQPGRSCLLRRDLSQLQPKSYKY